MLSNILAYVIDHNLQIVFETITYLTLAYTHGIAFYVFFKKIEIKNNHLKVEDNAVSE